MASFRIAAFYSPSKLQAFYFRSHPLRRKLIGGITPDNYSRASASTHSRIGYTYKTLAFHQIHQIVAFYLNGTQRIFALQHYLLTFGHNRTHQCHLGVSVFVKRRFGRSLMRRFVDPNHVSRSLQLMRRATPSSGCAVLTGIHVPKVRLRYRAGESRLAADAIGFSRGVERMRGALGKCCLTR